MKLMRWLGCVVAVAAGLAAAGELPARPTLDRIGVTRGICVVLGDPKGTLALALARGSQLTVYVQNTSAAAARAACAAADAAGLYGRRIYVATGDGARIGLATNLADAVVAPGGTSVPKSEVLRVLRPGGNALLGQAALVKPWPKGTDDWSHHYHGPDNNPQSRDRLARAPYLTQFIVEPPRGGAWVLVASDRADAKKKLWEQKLPGSPVRWGIAVDAAGGIVVALRDGRVLCYGKKG